jgi:hypothetical protein
VRGQRAIEVGQRFDTFAPREELRIERAEDAVLRSFVLQSAEQRHGRVDREIGQSDRFALEIGPG